MSDVTQNLQLPLLQGSDLVSKDKINSIVLAVDEKCLPVTHVQSKQHWAMWEPNKLYGLKDVVRTNTVPTWGFLECTQPGTSNATEPTGLVGEGDTKVDGTTAWVLKRLGSGVLKHGDLSGRQLPDQHPISAITNLQSALDKKADNADLHTHINKTVLDKITEDVSGRPLYNGELIGVSSAVWGGEYATHHDLGNIPNPVAGYNYVVTADETKNGQRTYYTYTSSNVFQYLGTFYDGIASGGTTAVGGVSASSQWSSANVVAVGDIKIIALTNNPTFNFVGPTILKEEQGTQNILSTVNEFNNGEASSFKFDSEFVEFIGGQMKLKTNFQLPTVANSDNPDCQYYRSTITLSKYKNIERVVI